MPIYAYKCDSCGFAKDVLQKMSDAPLTECPACAATTFKKQLTAAGFQLKGSGWYATDFKGGSSSATASVAPPGDVPATAATDTKASESATSKAETPSASTGT